MKKIWKFLYTWLNPLHAFLLAADCPFCILRIRFKERTNGNY